MISDTPDSEKYIPDLYSSSKTKKIRKTPQLISKTLLG